MSNSTVLCNGCFDPLHIGHLWHFQAARKMGETLVVAVTKNGFVKKGKGRPMFHHDERAAMIRALAIVDEVIIVESSIEALSTVKPQHWCIGSEYRHKLIPEDASYCRAHGIHIHYTEEKTYSSTRICALLRED